MSKTTAHFDEIYAGDDDPWHFRTSWYEIRKRSVLMSSLPRPSYGSAFEPGCANGEFTAELASRCHRVVSWDCSARAVELAQLRLTALPHVLVECHSVPTEWPCERFDLIVLNEMAYFLDDTDLRRLCVHIAHGLNRGGTVLACHWRHAQSENDLGAERLHLFIGNSIGLLESVVHHVEQDFVLDVWESAATDLAGTEASQ